MMNKRELLTAIETETLMPRYEHEERVKELAKELYAHTFTENEFRKMKKETLKRIAWILGLWFCVEYDKSAAVKYVSRHLINGLSNEEMFSVSFYDL